MNQSFAIDLSATESVDLGTMSLYTYYWASMYNQDEYLTGLPIAEGGGDTPDAAMANLFHNVQRTLTFSSIDDSEVNAT